MGANCACPAQELVLDGLPLTVFDVGGQEKIRELWSQYCRAADGLVLVVDAGDPTRFIDVRTELVKLLHGTANLSNSVVLVLANKQDQPQSLAPTDLSVRLRLHEIEQRWHIEGTIGLDGTGIARGFDWLMSHLSHAKGSRKRAGLLSRGPSYEAADSEHRASQAGKELRALHSLAQARRGACGCDRCGVVITGRRVSRPSACDVSAAQELEMMRVQNEQLASRLFMVEQRNAELARENQALRAAAGPHVATARTPVSEVRQRALEARATAQALRTQNHAIAEDLTTAGVTKHLAR